MRSHEHRSVGDIATDGAMVNAGGESPSEAFWLTFGDVVALSGDFFPPDGLTTLAAVPGHGGTRLGTRDELVAALKVATVDEGVADRRFDPGGPFGHFAFSPRADRSDVERAVRDRYLSLAAVNDDHFVRPGRSDARTGSGFPSAAAAYRGLHHAALDVAWELGRRRGDLTQAMAREAAAQHYLTDSFASGHLRTPVADIRRYWKARYPGFWVALQRRVASDTASALREVTAAMRLLPPRYLHRRTQTELTARTSAYPELSVGDLVARCFHDWDNTHGLRVAGGGSVFGDGSIGRGITMDLAVAAVQAGNDDVEVAYRLGASGASTTGERLYEEVRRATGAGGSEFLAEMKVPRVVAGNPSQNWQAPDAEALWDTPMVGDRGPTVGDALVEMLDAEGQFVRQLESLGEGLAGSHGPCGAPVIGPWLTRRCCQAFHHGFVAPLARNPAPLLLDLVNADGPSRVPASTSG